MTPVPSNIPDYYETTLAAAPKVVREYYLALNAQDGPRLRATLCDDFCLDSPLGQIGSADETVGMVTGFGGWVETSDLVVDGDRVAHFFTYHMTAPATADIRTCDLLELRDGKISVNHHYANMADFPAMGG